MWEYKTETFGTSFDTNRSLKKKCHKVLDKYSSEGWELVNFQCASLGTMMIMIFKRLKKIQKY